MSKHPVLVYGSFTQVTNGQLSITNTAKSFLVKWGLLPASYINDGCQQGVTECQPSRDLSSATDMGHLSWRHAHDVDWVWHCVVRGNGRVGLRSPVDTHKYSIRVSEGVDLAFCEMEGEGVEGRDSTHPRGFQGMPPHPPPKNVCNCKSIFLPFAAFYSTFCVQ